MRRGKVVFQPFKSIVQVIWDDAKHLPEPFPLILTRRLSKDDCVCFIEHQVNKGYVIYVPPNMYPLKAMWAGMETLEVKEGSHEFPLEPLEIPIEVADQESACIQLPEMVFKPNIQEYGVWDPSKCVMRHKKTHSIWSVPSWSVWQTLVKQKQPKEYILTLRWNSLLEKYQVDTIKEL